MEKFEAKDRRVWRRWLEKHHNTAPGVWLVYYKKDSGKPSISYAEAVEESLCFGWIDSRPNPIDDERHMQLFSPRTAGSAWSKLNRERAERLISQGLMTPAGMAKVESAKRDGSWHANDDVDGIVLPLDLSRALSVNKAAQDNFDEFSPSSKKIILNWIAAAKRPETRARRIEETVELAAQNLRPNH